MKSFRMLKLPMMLVGLGAALALSPSCKAQEVSPDHFTDTGVQNVYESAPAKTAAPKPKQSQPTATIDFSSKPFKIQICHSEGIRRGCPKNLNFEYFRHVILGHPTSRNTQSSTKLHLVRTIRMLDRSARIA